MRFDSLGKKTNLLFCHSKNVVRAFDKTVHTTWRKHMWYMEHQKRKCLWVFRTVVCASVSYFPQSQKTKQL